MIFDHINLLGIVAGIVTAILFEFVIKPEKRVIFKYPHPKTAAQTIYKDKNGVCFKYDVKEMNCDSNESRLKDFPIQ
jgi:hypothetical protein